MELLEPGNLLQFLKKSFTDTGEYSFVLFYDVSFLELISKCEILVRYTFGIFK